MKEYGRLLHEIAQVTAARYEPLALEVFRYQARHNPVYAEYLSLLNCRVDAVQRLADVPPLPIQLFKTHLLQTGQWTPQRIFTSSGTTGTTSSRHALRSEDWYRKRSVETFAQFYGPVEQYCVLALLPAYLERQGSSLVFMVDHFIGQSHQPESGFFLYDYEAVVERLNMCRQNKQPTLLIGVSFALLDLVERHTLDFPELIVMETGGMKGRRKELTREELHEQLRAGFGVPQIHSEYGMTELLSQAYSKGNGLFFPGKTMRVITRDVTDPFESMPYGRTGTLQIVDLANVDTISFIATEDLGKVYADGSFEVLGRLDASDIRGCNLMVE